MEFPMKKLVTVSLVLASGAALAQSSVTLYGIADLNIASRKTAGGERVLKVDSSEIGRAHV
jgi:predicted porin